MDKNNPTRPPQLQSGRRNKQLTTIWETDGKIGKKPPNQVVRKASSISSDNFRAPSEKVRHKTIKGKPPRKHVYTVHTEPKYV